MAASPNQASQRFTFQRNRKLTLTRVRSPACGEALLDIINDILDYSKLEAGKLDIEVTSFDMRQTVQSVMSILRPTADEKGLDLDVHVAEETPALVIGDQGRIRQVLINLVSNGVKFTEHGSVAVHVGFTEAGGLGVRVVDSGMGIPAAAMEGLFVEFNQLEASMARRFGGTGLGLAICKRLIGLMGGTIGVESTVGLGSRFWFEVPVKADLNRTAPGSAPALAPSAPCGLDILVVDDNAVNRQIVGKIITRLGHAVDFASNGEEAVSAVAAKRYDMAFMDLQMPRMDGYAATRAIRALAAPANATPIAALTANAGNEDRILCLAAGMDGFTTKPVSLAKLQAVILDLAARRTVDDPPAQVGPPCGLDLDQGIRDALVQALGRDGLLELDVQLSLDVSSLLADIEQASSSGDLVAVRTGVHTIRGASANLGQNAIVRACDRVRQACTADARATELRHAVGLLAETCRRRLSLQDGVALAVAA